MNRRLLAATVASTLAALVIPLLANPAAAHQAMDDAAARALAIVGLVVGALGLMAGRRRPHQEPPVLRPGGADPCQ